MCCKQNEQRIYHSNIFLMTFVNLGFVKLLSSSFVSHACCNTLSSHSLVGNVNLESFIKTLGRYAL
uniref:Uncharacterized protein n=1 Tax=Ciona intestinalis TaxID=7719 RepID=H2XWD8_CIOIN